VTIGATGQGMVAGDLVNTASRLQSVAPAGAVLVGESTFHSASASISFEEAGEQLLKGKTSPVPAWRAVAVVGLRGGANRGVALEPPFTGRDDDLRLLKELFHATERERKSRLVSVIGQGGIGKSRLAWEFEKYIDGVVGNVYWHEGRSPAYGEGISYWALAEMVRGRAGIAESDDAATATTHLHETLVEWMPDEQERTWVEPRVAALLALEEMPAGSRDELFAAWRTFFERIAERGPAVLVFEDIQWADDGMIDFIADLLDRLRNVPLFVVTLARPELYERRPGWGSTLRSLTSMTLDPLSREQMAQMVTGTVPGLPARAVGAVVGRADGIPLYAVETLRMLLDRGDLVRGAEGQFELKTTLDSVAVPDTLQSLIAARLDALGERDRRLIQTAAVVGQSFTLGLVAAVSSEPADGLHDRLDTLVQRQMLQVNVDPRSPERGQYQFVQAVVREVAAASLSRPDRRALHLAAARYYESLGDDELAGVQASHYVEAYRATPAGPEADALAAQARVSLRAAADRAIALHSNRQALAYLEQALAVTADPREQEALHERAILPAINDNQVETATTHAREVERLSRARNDPLATLHAVTLIARVELSHHRERAAIAALEPALAAVASLPDSRETVEALAELGRAHMIASANREAIELCDRALASTSLADDALITDLLITKGTALANSGRHLEGEILLRGAKEVAERAGDNWAALRAMNNAMGVVSADDVRAGLALSVEGYEMATRFGLTTWAHQFLGTAMTGAFDAGDWESWMDEAVAADLTGFYGGWVRVERGVRAALRGDLPDARRLLAEAVEFAGVESTQATAGIAALSASIELAAGRPEAALAAVRPSYASSDGLQFATLVVGAASAALDRAEPAREVIDVFRRYTWRGRHADGLANGLEAVLAAIEERWADARSLYLAARRDLTAAGALFALAMLNATIGVRAAGHFPEAAEAWDAARDFFGARGAQSFLDSYRASVVADPGVPARQRVSESAPNAAR
jgi:tetratricopeptide (TPR) repeat protein